MLESIDPLTQIPLILCIHRPGWEDTPVNVICLVIMRASDRSQCNGAILPYRPAGRSLWSKRTMTVFWKHLLHRYCSDKYWSADHIGDAEVLSIAHDCPGLSEICLSGCKLVTDASVRMLPKWCPRLISIDIGGCHEITDERLVAFGCAIDRYCLNQINSNLMDSPDCSL